MTIPVSGRLIKALRKAKGWSLGDLVRETEGAISRSTIIRIEKKAVGAHPATANNAEALADAFGIGIHDLCGETTNIIEADGDFRAIKFEFFSVRQSDGGIRIRHEGTNLDVPDPDHKIVAMLGTSPDTLIVRANED